jgi:hypothetical protein
MTFLAEHIRCRLCNDASIASSVAERRVVACTVLELARTFDLLSFGMVDTHLHMAKAGGSGGAELARRVEGALTKRLGHEVGFEKARIKPVTDPWHLYRLFSYTLTQGEHHGVDHLDPFFEGTNLPDLLGLRAVGRYTVANVRRHLPRVNREQLLDVLGVKCLEPADGPLEEILEAMAAAVCRPAIVGRGHTMNAARRAAMAVIGGRLRRGALAELLGLHPASVSRLLHAPVDAELVAMLRLQLGLRQQRWRQATGQLPPGPHRLAAA